jgi:hypothetical protein
MCAAEIMITHPRTGCRAAVCDPPSVAPSSLLFRPGRAAGLRDTKGFFGSGYDARIVAE